MPLSLLPGTALTVVLLATIGREVLALPGSGVVAALALVAYVASQWPSLPPTGRLILVLAVGLGATAVPWVADLPGQLDRAARNASYYVSLFTAVGFLRAAAETSPMIRRAGRHMIQQPPSRRYFALTLGANLFGLILSFGTLQLLGTMIRRANTLHAAGGDIRVQRVRARRLYTAVLRGFALSSAWSPLSVVLAITLAVTPGAQWQDVLPLALVTAMGLLAVGWGVDVATAPRRRARIPAPVEKREHWSVQLRLVGLILFVFAAAVALEESLQIRLIDGVIIAVPLTAIAWMLVQRRRLGPARALALTCRRLHRQVADVFPTYRLELTILSSAAFAGAMLAAALPADDVAAVLRTMQLPAALIPGLIVVAVVLGGQLALNPIITVITVAAVLPSPAVLGVPPAVMAVAYMASWGLAVGGSPFTLSTLIIGAISGHSGRYVGHVWNGAFTVLGVVLVTAWLAALAAWWA